MLLSLDLTSLYMSVAQIVSFDAFVSNSVRIIGARSVFRNALRVLRSVRVRPDTLPHLSEIFSFVEFASSIACAALGLSRYACAKFFPSFYSFVPKFSVLLWWPCSAYTCALLHSF